MPLYEYRCPVCETVEEVFRNLDERDDPLHCQNPECPQRLDELELEELDDPAFQMERIHSRPALETREPISNPARMPKFPAPKWY